ncbi:hypothetical protein RND81_07G158100 [Saponaria officinalis]|uniref:Uncharacterized protein n=1 Tax=Saponaria officinalis TaxID=3572 RepID=A0AAW1JSQ7_SAPOF
MTRLTLFFVVACFALLQFSSSDYVANNCMRKMIGEPCLAAIDSSLKGGKPLYPPAPNRGTPHQQIRPSPPPTTS